MSAENKIEITNALSDKKLVIGTDAVIKGLKKETLTKVFLSSNTPEIVKMDVDHYAKLTGVKVVQLEVTNEEIGELCKKKFFISIVAISK